MNLDRPSGSLLPSPPGRSARRRRRGRPAGRRPRRLGAPHRSHLLRALRRHRRAATGGRRAPPFELRAPDRGGQDRGAGEELRHLRALPGGSAALARVAHPARRAGGRLRRRLPLRGGAPGARAAEALRPLRRQADARPDRRRGAAAARGAEGRPARQPRAQDPHVKQGGRAVEAVSRPLRGRLDQRRVDRSHRRPGTWHRGRPSTST